MAWQGDEIHAFLYSRTNQYLYPQPPFSIHRIAAPDYHHSLADGAGGQKSRLGAEISARPRPRAGLHRRGGKRPLPLPNRGADGLSAVQRPYGHRIRKPYGFDAPHRRPYPRCTVVRRQQRRRRRTAVPHRHDSRPGSVPAAGSPLCLQRRRRRHGQSQGHAPHHGGLEGAHYRGPRRRLHLRRRRRHSCRVAPLPRLHRSPGRPQLDALRTHQRHRCRRVYYFQTLQPACPSCSEDDV